MRSRFHRPDDHQHPGGGDQNVDGPPQDRYEAGDRVRPSVRPKPSRSPVQHPAERHVDERHGENDEEAQDPRAAGALPAGQLLDRQDHQQAQDIRRHQGGPEVGQQAADGALSVAPDLGRDRTADAPDQAEEHRGEQEPAENDHQDERLAGHAEALEEEGDHVEDPEEPRETDHAPVEDPGCPVVEWQQPLGRSVRGKQEPRDQDGEPHLDSRDERPHDQLAARPVALVEGQERRERREGEDGQEKDLQDRPDHQAAGVHSGPSALAAIEAGPDVAEQPPHHALGDPSQREEPREEDADQEEMVRAASFGEAAHGITQRGRQTWTMTGARRRSRSWRGPCRSRGR